MEANLTLKQRHALKIVQDGHSVYIGGQAGVGKSFLIERILSEATKSGKRVALTCTTGIACSNFPQSMGAMTVHKWSGVGDGRFSAAKLQALVLNDDRFSAAKQRICSTDILIIDEISMLSLSLFDKLAHICRIKDQHLTFGGIQIVVVGDFKQLPPVPSVKYGDMGEFCFSSPHWPCHTVHLDEVIRQKDERLINLIKEFSAGNTSDALDSYARSLSRPLADRQQEETVRLFSNNTLVDMFNRDAVLKMLGQLYSFEAVDSGVEKELDKLVVQKTVWLKVGAKVMLLRNLSDKLVNGLRGTVTKIADEMVTVYFADIDRPAELSRISFTVFDPTQNRNTAERYQIPLKLAYGLTIHKAQGMTLKRVEVDCRQIFAPGQLGVAIGRVQSEEGLRIVNFTNSAVIRQPTEIQDYLQKESDLLLEDLSCCHTECGDVRSVAESIERTLIDVPLSEWDTEMDLNDDNSFDADFTLFVSSLSEEQIKSPSQEQVLPADFNINSELKKLQFVPPINTFQQDVNKLIDHLLQHDGLTRTFCQCQWNKLSTLYTKNILSADKSVPQAQLTLFYQQVQSYMTSDPMYKTACLHLFESSGFGINEVEQQFHICFNLIVAIRKLLLIKKAEKLPICSATYSNRSVQENAADSARGKIRYIGGYTIAKLRYMYCKRITCNCHKTSGEAVSKYESAKIALEVLDGLRASENAILQSSVDTGSLIETTRKQNINRGLTNITDSAYFFFTEVVNQILTIMSGPNVSIHGSNLYEFTFDQLQKKLDLFQKFVASCNYTIDYLSCDTLDDSLQICQTMNNILDKVTAIELVYNEIIHKVLSVLLKQFTRDMLMTLRVEKKMEHRKQIKVSKARKSTEGSLKKKAVESKTVKNLSGDVNTKQPVGISEQIADNVSLSNESSVEKKKKKRTARKKALTVREYSQDIPIAGSSKVTVKTTRTKTAERKKTSEANSEDIQTAGISKKIYKSKKRRTAEHVREHSSDSESDYEDDEQNEDICAKCGGVYEDGEDWMNCDYCMKWFHRKCCGLSNVKKWKKISKSYAKFACPECK